MAELLIIKTANAEKVKNILVKSRVEYQIVYSEPLTNEKPTKKGKLQQYTEKKAKKMFLLTTTKPLRIRSEKKN